MREAVISMLSWRIFVVGSVDMEVTIELISQFTGVPKKGPNPSQYFWGKDNNKKVEVNLNNIYKLQHDRCAYVVHIINEKDVCITTRILTSKVGIKN